MINNRNFKCKGTVTVRNVIIELLLNDISNL